MQSVSDKGISTLNDIVRHLSSTNGLQQQVQSSGVGKMEICPQALGQNQGQMFDEVMMQPMAAQENFKFC